MINWQDVIISSDMLITEVISLIERSPLRVAVVVKENYKLEGIVTDGDVRRGLLSNVQASEPVSKIMNKQPKYLPYQTDKTKIDAFLEQHQLVQVPLVNELHQVVGIEMLERFSWKQRHENAVFLMAGGFGKRLHPLTADIPKPLLKVGQYPVLQNIIESFVAKGFYRFYIAVHYKSDMIQSYFGNGDKWGVEIEYLYEEKPLGTAGALGSLPPQDKPVIVMNGDLLTKVDFSTMLQFHFESDALATMGVREYDFQVPYGIVKSDNFMVTELEEKPVYNFFVNAGFYILSPQLIKQVKQNEFMNMTDLLNQAMKANQKVVMFPIHEYWLDIGRFDDFEKANKEFAEHF